MQTNPVPRPYSRLAATLVSPSSIEPLEARIAPAAGVLDLAFSTDGFLTQDFSTGGADNDGAEAVVVQPDGKVVIAGFAQVGTNDFDFFVARYLRNGAPDTSFASPNGFVRVPFNLTGILNDQASSVALQGDGKILVAGFATATGGTDFAVARLNADGTLDTGFDGDGLQTVAFDRGGSNNDFVNDIVVQPDGKIVLAGGSNSVAGLDFAVARLNANGALDTDFDGDGKATFAIDIGGTNSDIANAVVLSGERIVLVGTAENSTTLSEVAIVALTSAGAVDPAFGGGIVTARFSLLLGDHEGRDADVQGDGKIVIVGKAPRVGAADSDTGVLRLTTTGTLDPTFSADGRLTLGVSNAGTRDDAAEAVVIQPDGKIVVAGTGPLGTPTATMDFYGLRLLPDGAIDQTYNGSGVRFYDLTASGTNEDTARAVALSADGIVIAGTVVVGSSTDAGLARIERDEWVVTANTARGSTVRIFTPTGTPLFSFDAFPATYKGGITVAAGDITGDGLPEIFAAPVKGIAPVVRVFDGLTFELLREIPVFAPTYRGAVNIAVGDVLDPTNGIELIVAPGKGLAANVEIYDPTTVAAPLKTFLAFDAPFKGGVRLATGGVVSGGRLEIIAGQASAGGTVKVFDANIATPAALETFQPFGARFRGGVFVGATDKDNNGSVDVLIGAATGAAKVVFFKAADDTLFGATNFHGTGFTGGAQVSAGLNQASGDFLSVISNRAGRPLLKILETTGDTVIAEFNPLGGTTKGKAMAFLVGR